MSRNYLGVQKLFALDTKQLVGPFKWRFQAFKVKKRNSNDIREISPKLGSSSSEGTFRKLVYKRPDVKESGSFGKLDVQSSSFGDDTLNFASNVEFAKATDLVTLMVQAGFNEISQLTETDQDVDID